MLFDSICLPYFRKAKKVATKYFNSIVGGSELEISDKRSAELGMAAASAIIDSFYHKGKDITDDVHLLCWKNLYVAEIFLELHNVLKQSA